MSAWIVDKKHIDLMVVGVTLGTRDGVVPPCRRDKGRLGQMLVGECVAPVRHRYPDDDVDAGELPGPSDPYYLKPYRFEDPKYLPSAAELCKAIACYEYQSCERPRWKPSAAKRLCDRVTRRIEDGVPEARRLISGGDWPAYEAAPWGFDAAEIAPCYAQADPDGRTFLRVTTANPQDALARRALSDWLIDRGLLAEPLSDRFFQFADLAGGLTANTVRS